MLITITPSRQIKDVQKDFNQMFPFLKLEFFHNPVFGMKEYNNNNRLPSNRKIGRAQYKEIEGSIDVEPSMTVSQLEKDLSEKFNLSAQVFRKSGNVWLETNMTDSWTLEQQNRHGEEIAVSTKRNETEDFDMTRDQD